MRELRKQDIIRQERGGDWIITREVRDGEVYEFARYCPEIDFSQAAKKGDGNAEGRKDQRVA